MKRDDYNTLLAGLDADIGAIPAAHHRREPDGVVLVNGADLTPEPVQWLWRDWLALGKMHLLAGAPGQGKTTIAIGFASTITIGGRWPDGSRCDPGNVLVWSGEDDPADTLLPRLLAAGGDSSRLFFVTGSRINGELQSFDPARDMQALQAQAERIGDVRLIVVDPVVSAVTGNGHQNTEVRRALQPLVDLAANMNAALLGITHFSKGGQGGDPAQRVIGSVGFTAVARVVLVAAKVKAKDGDARGADRRILARGKSNIGPDDGGYEYGLEQTEPLPGIMASRVEWGSLVQGSARELLTDPTERADDDGDDGQTALQGACDFLRAVLDCPSPAKYVQEQAREAGIAWRTVRRAADELGVIKAKGYGDSTAWYWRLCKVSKTGQGGQDVQSLKVDTLDTLDTSPPEITERMQG
jgi:putative DNA primase/helicase